MMKSLESLIEENKQLKITIKNLRVVIQDLKDGWQNCIDSK